MWFQVEYFVTKSFKLDAKRMIEVSGAFEGIS